MYNIIQFWRVVEMIKTHHIDKNKILNLDAPIKVVSLSVLKSWGIYPNVEDTILWRLTLG